MIDWLRAGAAKKERWRWPPNRKQTAARRRCMLRCIKHTEHVREVQKAVAPGGVRTHGLPMHCLLMAVPRRDFNIRDRSRLRDIV